MPKDKVCSLEVLHKSNLKSIWAEKYNCFSLMVSAANENKGDQMSENENMLTFAIGAISFKAFKTSTCKRPR